jgi:hypothetical protein
MIESTLPQFFCSGNVVDFSAGPISDKITTFFTNGIDNSIRNRRQLILRQWERQKKSESDAATQRRQTKNPK